VSAPAAEDAASEPRGAEGTELTIDPVSDAAEAAVAAARRLIVSLLHAERVPAGEMTELAAQLGGLADRLEPRVPPVVPEERTWANRSREDAALRNPVNGRQNAIAPGLRIRGMPDGSVAAEVTLGVQYEGPPGCVHGGVSALLLDHIFGIANFWAGATGPTAELTLRYRRPTPLFTPLTVRARQESADGRKLRTTGTIEAGGKVCVEAEGLFIVKQDFSVRS
jgi:acyl-coenzyme A thioesterase PaaI-like protein